MPTDELSSTILVFTGPPQPDFSDLEYRRDTGSTRTPHFKPVQITELHGQINVFLQQLNQVMADTPDKVGGFRLEEFEVNAGIVLEASGGVRLALFANAEVSGSVNAGLKFVFKRA